ncbi:MAG: hypothetical protein DSY33_00195 [Archaeoglobus sp.]|jgi:mannose-6-phosphate isomerase|nr:MAG: hypothetical protein DSY33_00195 [Archaeoglobus sp.]
MKYFLIQIEENLVEKPWAGDTLSKLKGVVGEIGESWEISPHPKRPSLVEYEGKIVKMSDVFEEVSAGYKPLLVKFIDAGEKLSVQVHPSDEDAEKLGEEDRGKEEAWITLNKAELMVGFKKQVEREEFLKAVEELRVEELLNKVECEKYEGYHIPPKTVHAICRGLIYEISTCSDITYRVYDYGRGRELHLEKALEVIDFNQCNPSELKFDPKKDSLKGENFEIRMLRLFRSFTREIENKGYCYVSCVEGFAELSAYGERVKLNPFKSAFVTCNTDSFMLSGSGAVIVAKPRS